MLLESVMQNKQHLPRGLQLMGAVMPVFRMQLNMLQLLRVVQQLASFVVLLFMI